MASSKTLIFSLLVITISAAVVSAHNITDILAADPDLSQFNSYLSQTKLADDINSRTTITVLAVTNAAMSAITSGNHPLSGIKSVLSLHILLDYFDAKKLHDIKDGSAIATTVYQTTGQADGEVGKVNITDVKGGGVVFGSAEPGAKHDSKYVKEIKTIPFNISVIQISAPIVVQSLLTSGTADVNVTAVLEKAGCKTFAALLASSGVLKTYQTQLASGITIFAPNDEAFKAKGSPDLSKTSNAELVSLLQFHALTSYAPIGTLKSSKSNLQTLAPAGKYGLTASAEGDSITLHTGVDNSRIATTVVDATPVAIYTVDKLLKPVALFGVSPAPAPAPESDSPAPAPSPKSKTPTPAPAPSTSPAASPPAPPMDTPAASPDGEADSPKAADEHTKNGASQGNAPLLTVVAVSVFSGVVSMLL